MLLHHDAASFAESPKVAILGCYTPPHGITENNVYTLIFHIGVERWSPVILPETLLVILHQMHTCVISKACPAPSGETV